MLFDRSKRKCTHLGARLAVVCLVLLAFSPTFATDQSASSSYYGDRAARAGKANVAPRSVESVNSPNSANARIDRSRLGTVSTQPSESGTTISIVSRRDEASKTRLSADSSVTSTVEVRRNSIGEGNVKANPPLSANGPKSTAKPRVGNGVDSERPILSRRSKAAITLPRRGQRRPSAAGKTSILSGKDTMVTTFGSLGVVVGLFLLVAWGVRRGSKTNIPNLPKEVIEVLGRTTFAGRQQLYLVRLGNKLLLLMATASGTETLAELTDGPEIDRIVGLCQQGRADSITASFRDVLSQLGRESPKSMATEADDLRRRGLMLNQRASGPLEDRQYA